MPVDSLSTDHREYARVSRIVGDIFNESELALQVPLMQKETGMQNAHQESLTAKHASLDQRITEENLRPFPDMATLARLKKEKLRLKDELTGHFHH